MSLKEYLLSCTHSKRKCADDNNETHERNTSDWIKNYNFDRALYSD